MEYHIGIKYIANTEGHMAVYGPVRHQKNIIWTEASDLYMDWSIYCHMTRSDMNYLLYNSFYLK
jgi:hypothetical protein